MLNLNKFTESGQAALASLEGTIAVVSSTDPQRATIRADRDNGIRVEHGVAADTQVQIELDPETRQVAPAPQPTDPLAKLVLDLINPELPAWQKLTDYFCTDASKVKGIPPILLVDTDNGDQVLMGGDGATYEIHGPGKTLANFLAGKDFFPNAVFFGRLKIRGNFRGFSSITGGSMKVTYDV